MGQAEFSHNKLEGKIVEKFGTRQAFSEAVGCSMVALSCKLNNKMRISRDDIIRWCDLLDVPPNEIPEYFFTPKV